MTIKTAKTVSLFTMLGLILLPAILPRSVVTTMAAVAHAQQADAVPERETRKTPAMRERTYKRLSEAREQAEAGNYTEALETLNQLSRIKDINSYERAQMYNFYGFIYFTLENYPAAVRAYENVLTQEELPIAMESTTRYTLAQLYIVDEQYALAIDTLQKWFAISENPGPDPYVMYAQALYQQGQALEQNQQMEAAKAKYREAIPKVETALSIAEAQGKPPKEQWLLLLRAFYFTLDNYPKVEALLLQLLALNPKKEYWIQLSGINGASGDNRTQLLSYEMAYIQGMLTTSQEQVTMAQLYLQGEVPYKAAQVLQTGLDTGSIEPTAKNYRLLAQALMLAREDESAIAPLTKAASLSDDGELDLRLANVYANLGQWGEAVEAARAAIAKGGLRRPDQANILLGTALYNLERYEQAVVAFRVARNDERSQRAAADWITHIGNEQLRLEQLAAALNN